MTKRGKLLIFLGILAFALFNYPLLHIFNTTIYVGGIPLLIVYLFGIWLLTILVLWVGRHWLSPND